MISYTKSNSTTDLEGILGLQKSNLVKVLTSQEMQSQGFVTVDHTFEQLKKLNRY